MLGHHQPKQDFVQEQVRSHLMEIMKKNHSHLFSNPNFLDQVLHHLGYDRNLSFFDDLSKWYQHIINISFLEKSCLDDNIEEVILHSPEWSQIFSLERKECYHRYLSDHDWQLALEILCLKNKQVWNESSPFASYQLELFDKKWRATFIHHCLTPDKHSKLFLRSQKKKTFLLKQFNVTQGQETFLHNIVTKKKNILVTGATGSGKTSFLQSLLSCTGDREHITILEDAHELALKGPFATNLISSPVAGKTLKDYCHYAMRMRPDRIILGEIRSNEVVPFLLSLNTGHKGMMASLHANSAIDAISRLALLFQIYSDQEGILYQDIIKLICQGVDFIIHIKRKGICEVIEILGSEGTTPYYKNWD
jgi:type IV secretion system protein VirB11